MSEAEKALMKKGAKMAMDLLAEFMGVECARIPEPYGAIVKMIEGQVVPPLVAKIDQEIDAL